MSERDEQPDEPRRHRRGITAEQHMNAIREDREAEHNYRAMRQRREKAEVDRLTVEADNSAWKEQRRYEIARDCLAAMCGSSDAYFGDRDPVDQARIAVVFASALLGELEKEER